MLNSIKIFGLIGVLLCAFLTSSNADCPNDRGQVGGKTVPDVLSLAKSQNGFTATVEIITPEMETIMVTEMYNGAKKFGEVEINKVDQGYTRTYFYYGGTNELFEVEGTWCDQFELTAEYKYFAINNWVEPDDARDEIDLFGNLDYLGPTSLLVYAASVSSKAQYAGTERIDSRSVDRWFYCLNDNLYLEWWFDSTTSLPVRFSIDASDNSTEPHVYNFLIFNPLYTTVNDLVAYPLGYGCYRSATGQPSFPSFLNAESYSLDMEAMIMYSNPDKVLLSSNRMIKYQDTFSIEISEEPNTTRIIQNPEHMGRYLVNADTGECTSESLDWSDLEVDDLAITWPFHKKVGFNLMQVLGSSTSWWTNYMGQISTDQGVMDVWEIDLYSFFSVDNVMDGSVTYYFPAIDRTKNPNQAPVRIVIKPHNSQYVSMSNQIPDQIEIIIIDYEEDQIDLGDRFDITGCFDGPGESTWFQIVLSDASAGTYSRDLSTIKQYFEQTLTTFVPLIRIPEIVVNLYDFNFYVSVRLLERPPFKFYYSESESFIIENPTSILIRDHSEDCGDVCTNDDNCREFSYCSDMSCQIFSSTTGSTYAALKYNTNCSTYTINGWQLPDSQLDRNVLASTKSILTQIKAKIVAGEFVISKYQLSADDLFIVSGPDDIGGIEDEFDDSFDSLKGDEYAVVVSDRRLTSGETINSVEYSDCLQLCQNDDDCYSLSYCFNNHDECILSTDSAANITKSIDSKTSVADGCDVMEKSFIAFYRKFPGQSLVKDAISTITDIDESECARQCYLSSGLECKSFDYCTVAAEKGLKTRKSACFLHEFHAVEDTAHEITGNIWDFSTSSCDHYAVLLSRDYTHYVGRQFSGSVKVIDEISDVNLERCAADCNSADETCLSFEFCESVENDRGSKIATTCRLSSSSGDVVNYDSLVSTSTTCSVYLNKAKASQISAAQKQDHFGLAMGLGSFFFVAAFALGIAGSIFYQRRMT